MASRFQQPFLLCSGSAGGNLSINSTIKVTVLGSGTSTGVPVIGCQCEVCTSEAPENKRTRASMLVEVGDKTFLIDTSPDFRGQILRAGCDKVDAVLFTHTHADHLHGFDDLRALSFRTKATIPAYSSSEHLATIKHRFEYAFSETGYDGSVPKVELVPVCDGVNQISGVEVDVVTLPHGHMNTLAFRFGKFAYATDFKTFTSEAFEAWHGKIDVMVISGLHFGTHSSHSTIPESIEILKKLGVKRGFISHLAHNVDYWRDQDKLPEFCQYAFDGMKLQI